MEITNVCPYCGGEMREGALPAYKIRLHGVRAMSRAASWRGNPFG